MLVQCYVFLPGIVLVNIDGETFRWSERGLISIIHKRPDGSVVFALYASAMSSQSILARNVANMSSAHENEHTAVELEDAPHPAQPQVKKRRIQTVRCITLPLARPSTGTDGCLQ